MGSGGPRKCDQFVVHSVKGLVDRDRQNLLFNSPSFFCFFSDEQVGHSNRFPSQEVVVVCERHSLLASLTLGSETGDAKLYGFVASGGALVGIKVDQVTLELDSYQFVFEHHPNDFGGDFFVLTPGFEGDDGSIRGGVHFFLLRGSSLCMSLAFKFADADRDRRGESLQGMCRGM